MTLLETKNHDRNALGTAIEVRNATRIYGTGDVAIKALDAVDLDLPVGVLTAIMGPSGSGKSTLLHVMAGLDRLSDGTIDMGGTDLGSLTERQMTTLRRDRIGFVFQAYNLVPMLTVEENVRLPLTLARKKPDPASIEQIIDAVGLSDRIHHRPSELSGGQRQRVAIARALANNPDVVYADEPTGALDTHSAADVLGLLQHAARHRGQTIAMVTHDPVAASYADRVVFLVDGHIHDELSDPTVDTVLDAMRTLEV